MYANASYCIFTFKFPGQRQRNAGFGRTTTTRHQGDGEAVNDFILYRVLFG